MSPFRAGELSEDVVEARGQVRSARALRAVPVPRKDGVEDVEMFPYRLVQARLADVRDPPNAADVPPEHLQCLREIAVLRSGSNEAVRTLREAVVRMNLAAVHHLPCPLHLIVHRGEQLLGPCVLRREASGVRLESRPHLVALDDLPHRELSHDGTLAGGVPDEPLAPQDEDRLADRGAADPQAVSELVLGQHRPGRKLPVEDHLAQSLIGALGEADLHAQRSLPEAHADRPTMRSAIAAASERMSTTSCGHAAMVMDRGSGRGSRPD